MPKVKKKEVRRAIVRAKDILERNADPCETFEGVLGPGYVQALRTLLAVAEDFVARREPVTRRVT
jgi:hypothetical protein